MIAMKGSNNLLALLKHCVLLLLVLHISGCSLPTIDDRTASHALLRQDGMDTSIGRGIAEQAQSNPGLSGVAPLSDPLDAFAARVLLISKAERTIDLQYYIWRDDITGNLLLKALHQAAQRGVRVRLLIDDNGTIGLDSKLAVLNSEPNAEVRLFNPFPFRTFKRIGFITNFSRLNRRMHNKSMTVDGQITVVGGRNIGDEYFGATPEVEFNDLDVMVAGEVVDDVSNDFDEYWNSKSAYPIEKLVSIPPDIKSTILTIEEHGATLLPAARSYINAVAKSDLVENISRGQLNFSWVKVHMVSDDPKKVLGRARKKTLLITRLMEILDHPSSSVDLISPYFVPTKQGVDVFGEMASKGVKVRILTNALEATDVIPVHAGYAKYRAPLLKHGVELYEMRSDNRPNKPREKAGPFGSSGTSLHAKTFAIDNQRVFVGSFNFDPRSARLNTELGFVIESETMAQAISEAFDNNIPMHAYKLELDEEGNLVWLDNSTTPPRKWNTDPNTSVWTRLYVDLLSLLPIESLL